VDRGSVTVRVVPALGVLFLTLHPLEDLVRWAGLAEQEGLGSVWLADAPYWFRRFGHEPRGAVTVAATIAACTRTIGVGISVLSPYLRHPVVLAREAAALDEASGGRLTLALGVGRGAVNYLGIDLARQTPVATHREAVEIVRATLAGEALEYHGQVLHATVPAGPPAARARRRIPLWIGATGPRMIQLAGAVGDGLILPSLTTPAFIRHARAQLALGAARAHRRLHGFPIAAVLVCSVARDAGRARDGARRATAIYLANKLENIRNDTLVRAAQLTAAELAPVRDALDGKGDLSASVSDEILLKTSVVAGTPEQCVAILGELRAAGLTLPLLEVVGDEAETIRLLGREVAPSLPA
jgi:5,10-methylenetetrahydromethanopterin reductase